MKTLRGRLWWTNGLRALVLAVMAIPLFVGSASATAGLASSELPARSPPSGLTSPGSGMEARAIDD